MKEVPIETTGTHRNVRKYYKLIGQPGKNRKTPKNIQSFKTESRKIRKSENSNYN